MICDDYPELCLPPIHARSICCAYERKPWQKPEPAKSADKGKSDTGDSARP